MERKQLSKILMAKRDELTLRREKIHADFSTRHISKNFNQQTKERENDEVLTGLDEEAEQELARIELALKRLDTDNFQHCKTCGETISDERILAIPSTIYCRDCAGASNTGR